MMRVFNKDVFHYILAMVCIVMTFLLFFIILLVDIKQQNKDIIIYILGVLSAIDTQIVSYYFGSSAGSKHKSDTINTMMEKTDEKLG